MQTRTESCAPRSGGRSRWWLAPLIALATSATAALASPPPASAPPTAKTTYRVVQLSAFTGNADINAKGQVAFTEVIGGVGRAKFYDGNTVRDIGTLGGPGAAIAAINDVGQIAGSSSGTNGVQRAFRWSAATGMIDLGGPDTGFASAADINNRGWVTGSAQFGGQAQAHAFRWTPQTGMVDLGSFNTNSNGFALNDKGTVVGNSESPEGGLGRLAVRWPASTPLALTTFATPFSTALDINSAGQIVGNGSVDPGFQEIAFLWSPQTGIVDLGVPGPTLASAEKINEKGLVIGSSLTPSNARGVVWSREHGLLIFGTLEVDQTRTRDLNNLGQVVGSFNNRAFVWTRASGVIDLNTRLVGAPPELELFEASAISDNGAIVAVANTGLVLLVPRNSYHQPPVASPIKITGMPRAGALLSFSASFKDVDVRDSHKAHWSWGDGSTTVGTVSEKNGTGSVSAQHAFRKNGTYTVRLTVTDSAGKSTTVHRTVLVCAAGAFTSG